MANTKAASFLRSSAPSGKQPFLPPRSPFPTVLSSYGDFRSTSSRHVSDSGDGQSHHRRTSSESFLIEEQPPWLDDLLNEPNTPPITKGSHRRSSSDSFAYLNGANNSCIVTNLSLEDCNPIRSARSPWQVNEADSLIGINHGSYYLENSSFQRHPEGKDKIVNRKASSLGEHYLVPSETSGKKVSQDSPQNPKHSLEKESSLSKQCENDQRSAKQQFARRSRVRKLQYIAELERNVQSLQAEGSDISAELEFLDQQNLMLGLENRSLKQRLDNLSQEQLIKHLQQEMLEREIARLRSLYQKQQQQSQHQSAPTHIRSRSRDLDSRFSSLSLKPNDMDAGVDPATSYLHS